MGMKFVIIVIIVIIVITIIPYLCFLSFILFIAIPSTIQVTIPRIKNPFMSNLDENGVIEKEPINILEGIKTKITPFGAIYVCYFIPTVFNIS